MGFTYFKRYRMEFSLDAPPPAPEVPDAYRFVAWSTELLDIHADVKYRSFCYEIDGNVFPCLADRDGCQRLMRDITRRDSFLPQATWLLEYAPDGREPEFCGTIQGVDDRQQHGAVQNLGVTPRHRGQGLGTALLMRALEGFRLAGLRSAYLEVTAQNTGAVRLYQRLGFRTVKTVYKAVEGAYA